MTKHQPLFIREDCTGLAGRKLGYLLAWLGLQHGGSLHRGHVWSRHTATTSGLSLPDAALQQQDTWEQTPPAAMPQDTGLQMPCSRSGQTPRRCSSYPPQPHQPANMKAAGTGTGVEDLIKYLDPQYIDRIAVPDSIKLEIILAEERYILTQASLLEELHTLQPLLDSEHIKAVPAQASKLQALSQVHIKQQDQCDEITAETKKMFEDYNKMTVLLSKHFVMWDETLSQLEAAKQVKPLSE
ncbi:dynactin subunit 3 isoform X1 [Pseudophryne corroboree]|uniref:dynactin subunit 3 isoform X1 n=1 Tax=Pseudophryne corroboree TaxID=495146 RepID=UPI003081DE1C